MEQVMGYLFLAVIIGIACFVMVITHRTEKRGCGRGCATCGNRSICYRNREKNQDRE